MAIAFIQVAEMEQAAISVMLAMLTTYTSTPDLKQLLEQEHQHKLEVRETLLMSIAVLGLHTQSPSAQLLVLAVLVGRLDDLDPGIRSYAAELLLGKARSCHHLACCIC